MRKCRKTAAVKIQKVEKNSPSGRKPKIWTFKLDWINLRRAIAGIVT